MACRVRCQSSGGGGGGFTQEQIEDFIGAMIVAGVQNGITVTYNDAGSAIDFTVATQWTQEQIEDFMGPMIAAGTQSGITVTYDDAGDAMNFTVDQQWTQEQIEDLVGAMAVGGVQTAITVTYDDASGTLDFVVTPGAFDIDSFPAASTPLAAGDLFVVSQGGTEGKVAYSDVSTGGGGSDPYGLLTTPGGWEWGDEFDDGAIDGAWTIVVPGGGTAVWTEANHRLSILGVSIADSDGAAIVRSIGTAWGNGTIIETEWGGGPNFNNVNRASLFVSDGLLSTSNSVGFMMLDNGGGAQMYTVHGTVKSMFGTSFVGALALAENRHRLRIEATTADAISFFMSDDGVSWSNAIDADGSAVYSIATLGWTPTHCGLAFSNVGAAIHQSDSWDYVRRFA